jgi:hypothetical protein
MSTPRLLPLIALSLLACEATMPPPPPAIPAPPPSGKAQLEEADILAAQVPLRESIDACVAQYQDDGKAEAILMVSPAGDVIDVSVHNLINFTQKRCLKRAARAAKFPVFTGPPMRVVWAMTATKKEKKEKDAH